MLVYFFSLLFTALAVNRIIRCGDGWGEIFKIHSLLLPAHIISHHLPVERTNVKDQFPVAPCEKHHTWEEERGKKKDATVDSVSSRKI